MRDKLGWRYYMAWVSHIIHLCVQERRTTTFRASKKFGV
jgi:hypothetical protein